MPSYPVEERIQHCTHVPGVDRPGRLRVPIHQLLAQPVEPELHLCLALNIQVLVTKQLHVRGLGVRYVHRQRPRLLHRALGFSHRPGLLLEILQAAAEVLEFLPRDVQVELLHERVPVVVGTQRLQHRLVHVHRAVRVALGQQFRHLRQEHRERSLIDQWVSRQHELDNPLHRFGIDQVAIGVHQLRLLLVQLGQTGVHLVDHQLATARIGLSGEVRVPLDQLSGR